MNQIVCAKPDQQKAVTTEMIVQWKQLTIYLLENKPAFQLKQLGFTAPDGELNSNGKISINGFQPAMLDDSKTAMTALADIVQIDNNASDLSASEKPLSPEFLLESDE